MNIINTSKAFQNELIDLINKYTDGVWVRKLSTKERIELARHYQVSLLFGATKVYVPSGTKNGIESVIRSNAKQYEYIMRMNYKPQEEESNGAEQNSVEQ